MVSGARRTRYETLDTWRGFACLLVVIYHSVFFIPTTTTSSAPWTGLNAVFAEAARRGWIGVPIFFVISGYCIAASIDSHRRKGTAVRTYFVKRFRRIFPPYWIVLFGTAIVVGAGDLALSGRLTHETGLLRPWWHSVAQWVGSASLTEQWRFHVIGGQKGWLLGHAWTLGYEEQFYAVTGLLLFLCPGRFFLGAAAVTAGVVAVAALGTVVPLPTEGFFFDGSWIQFALGILLFHTIAYGKRRNWILAAAVYTCVVVAAGWNWRALLEPDKNDPQVYLVAGVFAFAALVLHPKDAQLAQARALRPIARCGVMCYSLYLVHLPVANLVRAGLMASGVEIAALSPFVSVPLCAVPAIWLSWCFHVAVERRFMNQPSLQDSPAHGRPVAALS